MRYAVLALATTVLVASAAWAAHRPRLPEPWEEARGHIQRLLRGWEVGCPQGTERVVREETLFEAAASWCERPDGERHGVWLSPRPAGGVGAVGEYHDGVPHGLWVSFHGNGMPHTIASCRAGLLDGPWVWLDRRGRRQLEGVHRAGHRVGVWHIGDGSHRRPWADYRRAPHPVGPAGRCGPPASQRSVGLFAPEAGESGEPAAASAGRLP